MCFLKLDKYKSHNTLRQYIHNANQWQSCCLDPTNIRCMMTQWQMRCDHSLWVHLRNSPEIEAFRNLFLSHSSWTVVNAAAAHYLGLWKIHIFTSHWCERYGTEAEWTAQWSQCWEEYSWVSSGEGIYWLRWCFFSFSLPVTLSSYIWCLQQGLFQQ